MQSDYTARAAGSTPLASPDNELNDEDDALQAEPPTLQDLLAPRPPACVKCGSEAIRMDSPAMRWMLVIGGGMSAWVLFRGFVDAAVMLVITTVTLAAGVRARFHFRRCDRCGHEWRR
jgi:hypothetical protein